MNFFEKNGIRCKVAGVITAVAVSLSQGALWQPLAAFAEEQQVSALEQLMQQTTYSDFLSLAGITLYAYSTSLAGDDAGLSEQSKQMLDLDNSGVLDIQDAYTFLAWYSQYFSSGDMPEAAQQYLTRWESAQTTVPAEVTTVAPAAETTTEMVPSVTTAPVQTTVPATTTLVPAATTAVATTEPAQTTTATTAAATTTSTAASTTASTTTATTTVTTTVTTTATMVSTWAVKSVYNGVDVSKHQGQINWASVKNAGTEFAIIRAGFGKYMSQEDPWFDYNIQNAQKQGIACGAYWYSYAKTVADAKQEAACFAQVIEGYQFEYPLVFDIEEPTIHFSMTQAQVSAIIEAFCEEMESRGYYVSVYSCAWFLNNKLSQSVLDDYDIWVAHFGVSTPGYTKSRYGIWQYTGSGTVSGVSGNVDKDYSYRCYPNVMLSAHLNGF